LAILFFGLASVATAAPPDKDGTPALRDKDAVPAVSDKNAVPAVSDKNAVPAILETPDQVFMSALRQAIGSPSRADIGDQAAVRLADGLMFIPRDPASRLLTVSNKTIPSNFSALLLGSESMEAPGLIRFVPAGFVDSDAALAWTADDLLASLNDTVQQGNPARVAKNQQEREARRWVSPPHYNPESHQLTWCALIVPKSAPRETDGEITYHAVAFGREGYLEMTVVTSLQKAEEVGHMADDFLGGLTFRQGKGYGDAQPSDPRAPGGLAKVMEIERFHKAEVRSNFLAGDSIIPVAGGIVAAIGALSLIIYIQRHLRREARRG
jgi:uncharacterized membrane-anchored protein